MTLHGLLLALLATGCSDPGSASTGAGGPADDVRPEGALPAPTTLSLEGLAPEDRARTLDAHASSETVETLSAPGPGAAAVIAALADGAFPGLRTLDLSGSDVTDADLGALPDGRGLRTLRVADTPITAEGVGRLLRWPTLEHLDVSGTRLEAWPEGPGPALTTLVAARPEGRPTLAGLAGAPFVPRLTTLDLTLWRATPAAIRQLAVRATSLETLRWTGAADLSPDGGIGDAGAEALVAGLPALTDLRLDLQDLSPEGVAALAAAWPGLEHLDLRGNAVAPTAWIEGAAWRDGVRLEVDLEALDPEEAARLRTHLGERAR